jgi:hypothetical protein
LHHLIVTPHRTGALRSGADASEIREELSQQQLEIVQCGDALCVLDALSTWIPAD